MISTNGYVVVAMLAAAMVISVAKPVRHAAAKTGRAVVHVATLGKK